MKSFKTFILIALCLFGIGLLGAWISLDVHWIQALLVSSSFMVFGSTAVYFLFVRPLESLRNHPTQNQPADHQIHQSPELSQKAIEAIRGFAICTLDTKGFIRSWSPEAERLKGYSSEEAIGMHCSEMSPLFNEANREKMRERYHQILREAATHGQSIVETWQMRKNGGRYFAKISLAPLYEPVSGALEGFIKITQDITDAKVVEDLRNESESKLSESERKFRGLVQNLPGVVYRCELDPDWTMHWMSDQIEALSGYKASEFIMNRVRTYGSIVHPEDAALVEKAVYSAAAKGESYDIEYRIIHREGAIRWVFERGYAIRDSAGKVEFLDGVILDMTEKKLLHMALEAERAASLSSAKMASLGEMAGGIAHEINNPLAIIQGRADLIKRSLGTANPDISKLREWMEQIEKTAKRISQIVNSMRALSRDGTQDPMETIEVQKILEDVFNICQEKFQAHGIEIRIKNPGAPRLVCRPVQISQALLNLLTNAYDAIQNLPTKWIEVDILEIHSKLIIRITDSGDGISKSMAEKIMRPFFTTKEPGKGTGLGLSIARNIVESHGGKLWIDHSLSNTCFVMEIPTSQKKAA